eukprot:gene3291-biopygen13399
MCRGDGEEIEALVWAPSAGSRGDYRGAQDAAHPARGRRLKPRPLRPRPVRKAQSRQIVRARAEHQLPRENGSLSTSPDLGRQGRGWPAPSGLAQPSSAMGRRGARHEARDSIAPSVFSETAGPGRPSRASVVRRTGRSACPAGIMTKCHVRAAKPPVTRGHLGRFVPVEHIGLTGGRLRND